MDRDTLLVILRALQAHEDKEEAHEIANAALLEFIDDPGVTDEYRALEAYWA